MFETGSFAYLKSFAMLLMSSVLLFIQGNEVGYNLYVNDEGKYFFKPTTYTNRNFFPPTFWVYKLGAQWEFDDTYHRQEGTLHIGFWPCLHCFGMCA